MVYTLFYSRLRDAMTPELSAEYEARAAELVERARTGAPGFVDIKSFRADDGERLTVVRFRTLEEQRAWGADGTHVEAKRRGRSHYYAEYRIVVCQELDERGWPTA